MPARRTAKPAAPVESRVRTYPRSAVVDILRRALEANPLQGAKLFAAGTIRDFTERQILDLVGRGQFIGLQRDYVERIVELLTEPGPQSKQRHRTTKENRRT